MYQGYCPHSPRPPPFVFFCAGSAVCSVLCTSPAQHTTMDIESELSGLNRELSMFPERAFDFKNAGTVVIEQVICFVPPGNYQLGIISTASTYHPLPQEAAHSSQEAAVAGCVAVLHV